MRDRINEWIDNHTSPEMMRDIEFYHGLTRDRFIDLLIPCAHSETRFDETFSVNIVGEQEGDWRQFYLVPTSNGRPLAVKQLQRVLLGT